jgi:hypothetical protein
MVVHVCGMSPGKVSKRPYLKNKLKANGASASARPWISSPAQTTTKTKMLSTNKNKKEGPCQRSNLLHLISVLSTPREVCLRSGKELTPAREATGEAKIRKIAVQDQPGQNGPPLISTINLGVVVRVCYHSYLGG